MSDYPHITEVVPHAAPMLALDEVLEWSDGYCKARLTLKPDDLFARDGVIDTIVTFEQMAQTVAACLGVASHRSGHGVRVGMVIACRKMDILRPTLEPGMTLTLEARRIHGTEASSQFQTEARDESGVPIATATMTLVHP